MHWTFHASRNDWDRESVDAHPRSGCDVTVTAHYTFHTERNARVLTCRPGGGATYLTCQAANCPDEQSRLTSASCCVTGAALYVPRSYVPAKPSDSLPRTRSHNRRPLVPAGSAALMRTTAWASPSKHHFESVTVPGVTMPACLDGPCRGRLERGMTMTRTRWAADRHAISKSHLAARVNAPRFGGLRGGG
jgi:hypothetical protein